MEIFFALPEQITMGQAHKKYEFGMGAPPAVISDTNVMTVMYLTGLEINTVGFQADYKTVGNATAHYFILKQIMTIIITSF